jgi:hypothetical protein
MFMKKTKRFFLFFLIVALVLIGCNNSTIVDNQAEQDVHLTKIPTDSGILDADLLPTSHTKLEWKCPDIETRLPLSSGSGTLILDANDTYFLDIASLDMKQINEPGIFLSSFSISPNREWIAYRESQLNDRQEYLVNNLVITDSDHIFYKILQWNDSWASVNYWLNNDELVLSLVQAKNLGINDDDMNYLVINPITNESRSLTAIFPGIFRESPRPNWDGRGITAFNSEANQVIYLQGNTTGPYYYVLWDMNTQEILASFQVFGEFNAIPRWSNNGTQFALAPSLFSKAKSFPSYEIYIGSENGKIVELTKLTDSYPWIYIDDLSWSPDSNRIAFWFSYWEDEQPYFDTKATRYLAIADLITGSVTGYCINGEHDASIGIRIFNPPLWSPDSKQVIIQSQISQDSFHAILIDIQTQRAYHISENLVPVGWLK